MTKVVYTEEIELIGNIDGSIVCQMRWRDHVWEEQLPRGFDRWPPVEQKSHLKSFIIPKLRMKLLEAQKVALADPSTADDDCVPLIQYGESDIAAMNAAQEKRERKAAKLRLV